MLGTSFSDGNEDKLKDCAIALDKLLADPGLTDEERFDLRVKNVSIKAIVKNRETPGAGEEKWKAYKAEYEKGIRDLIKDYPKKDKPYTMLVNMAANSPAEKARSIATELLALPVSTNVATRAEGILRRLDAVGKSPDIKFTALDGAQVDLSSMKGSVVLVDFWATWCGPCVAEIPNVKAAYKRFHAHGFDVVGISFDSSRQSLEHFVQQNEMPWPQYFDGKGWENKFGIQYGIAGIPTMWLVDKNGKLRDANARGDLESKVEKLLAE
jgi:thiol-disulfide isomerase/thioredoxin